jgi:hypothetical protein
MQPTAVLVVLLASVVPFGIIGVIGVPESSVSMPTIVAGDGITIREHSSGGMPGDNHSNVVASVETTDSTTNMRKHEGGHKRGGEHSPSIPVVGTPTL